jgi:DNA transformation protein
MNRLTDLPNIGPKLAEHLEKAGIPSPEALREAGAETAFLRIRTQVDSTACLHELEALAGAVEGVRKSLLPPDRKAELKAWFRSLRS